MRITRALAFVAGLFFYSSATAQQPPGGQPDWLSQAEIVARMEGISIGEAVRRAKLQNLAVEQASRFSREDPEFAGSWIERGPNTFRVVFAFKGNAGKRIANPDLAAAGQTVQARYSLREIHAERERLTRELAALGANADFQVRQRENALHVYADVAKLNALRAEGTLTFAPFVEIREGPFVRVLQAAVHGAGPTTGAGLCTGGFNVEKGGVRGISTAGHCSSPEFHRSIPIGIRQGGQVGGGIDVQWFNNSSNTYGNTVQWRTSYYVIQAWAGAPVGENTSVCVIKRDDTQPCGFVMINDHYFGSDGPYIVMDRNITVGSDSGAPWLYGSVAYGIHTGLACNEARTLCYSYYTPAYSLPKIGINVVYQP